MIIIVISYGITCDKPFTSIYLVDPTDVRNVSVSSILDLLIQKQDIEINHVDEIIVIQNDAVQARYESNQINAAFEEIDEDELDYLDADDTEVIPRDSSTEDYHGEQCDCQKCTPDRHVA